MVCIHEFLVCGNSIICKNTNKWGDNVISAFFFYFFTIRRRFVAYLYFVRKTYEIVAFLNYFGPLYDYFVANEYLFTLVFNNITH